jgi:release factor glutamine methyltransferase
MYSKFQKKYSNRILKPYLQWYLKKERNDTIKGFKLLIKPSVFHPRYFFSSLFLFDFVNGLKLENKNFFEIGCGSGLLSLLAYKKKANVTCSDINYAAIESTLHNFNQNFADRNSNFVCVKSDLFDAIPQITFDFVIINPPYFFKEAIQPNQFAWNCGENGQYFVKLFSGLKQYTCSKSFIYMVLGDNCEIDRIKKIAKENNFAFKLVKEEKIKWEINYIFEIKPF